MRIGVGVSTARDARQAAVEASAHAHDELAGEAPSLAVRLGGDRSTGSIRIGEVVEVGATVQFQVGDAVGADKDLRLALERAAAHLAGRPVGALLFTCNGRGRRMFGVADHDASTIAELLGGVPLAGFFAGGEIGPIAGRNALHAFTASTLHEPRAWAGLRGRLSRLSHQSPLATHDANCPAPSDKPIPR